VSVRVRFADFRSVTRSITLPAPISATAILADIAEDLVRGVLAHHPDERTISLLAISVSKLGKQSRSCSFPFSRKAACSRQETGTSRRATAKSA
jgi:impB/mucB/samB family protein